MARTWTGSVPSPFLDTAASWHCNGASSAIAIVMTPLAYHLLRPANPVPRQTLERYVRVQWDCAALTSFVESHRCS